MTQPSLDGKVRVGDARRRERRNGEVERINRVPVLAQAVGERAEHREEQSSGEDLKEVLLPDRIPKRG